jgi:V/A-type H+-transporting ATPase subunit I
MKHAMEKTGMLMGLFALMIIACAYFDQWPFHLTAFKFLAGALLAAGVVLIFVTMGAMGLVGVLEILSLGSNVLSYARLMALGVAAIAIADIANGLPTSMGWFIGVPMAILIHALNIGISMASPTIHSLRLNFVEFLPKFYSPEGKSFNPFKKEIQW